MTTMMLRVFGVVVFVVLFECAASAQQAAPAASAPPAKTPAAAPTTTAPVASDKVELKLELPKQMFLACFLQMKKHLDPNTGKLRPPFLVPKDVILLSRGKKVTASENELLLGNLSMVTDGDKEGTDNSYIEFDRGLQWTQIDLDATAEIYAVVVWHYHSQARVYHDFIVQVSENPEFVKDVKTVYNNDYDNSSKLGVGNDWEYVESYEGRLVDAKGVKGRYVRCYSNGNSANEMNHMIEIEVYGRPAK